MNAGEKEQRDKRYIQILLMGCDVNDHKMAEHCATEKEKCERSDAMAVLSVDRVTGQIKLISLMRDVWVDIPGHGKGKLNAPVDLEGPELAVEVINSSFHLNIRKYAVMTVFDFVRFIDSFGGLDVELTIEEAIYINYWMPNVKIITGSDEEVPRITHDGWNHLNGMQTLAHVRNRSIGYMIGRENRINDVLTKIAKKAKNEMSLSQIIRFALKCRQYVRTDLRIFDILELLRFGLKVNPDSIKTYHAPAEGTYEVKTDGVWRMETDFEKASQQLWEFIEDRS